MSIDACTHSLFGVSKVAADLLVQEYGRYFGMPTVCFRGGCLTGPQHAGAELHGFLAYLMKCTVTGKPYTIFGYGGKQVRDNIHAARRGGGLRGLPARPARRPPSTTSAAGASRTSRCSRRSQACEQISRPPLDYTLSDTARIGDHRWYISDLAAFKATIPTGALTFGIEQILDEIHDAQHREPGGARA